MDGKETAFYLGSGQKLSHYSLAISQLKDFRGLEVGRLLLLRDVTEQKQAQAQIMEQQRVLATQNERERMARELHDSLGQVLSYTSFQVETAAKLFRAGQGADAAAQLDRLGNVVREAHADLREHILNLHSTASLQQPFFTVVEQYLDGFTSSYDIQTLLTLSLDWVISRFRRKRRCSSSASSRKRCRTRANTARPPGAGSVCMQEKARLAYRSKMMAVALIRSRWRIAGGLIMGCSSCRSAQYSWEAACRYNPSPGTGTQVVLEIPITG